MTTNPNPQYRKNIQAGLSVPSSVRRDNPDLARFLLAVKQHIELGHGNQGQPKERFVTLEDLQRAGIAAVKVVRNRGEIVGASTDDSATTTQLVSSGLNVSQEQAGQGQVLRYNDANSKWESVDFFDDSDNVALTYDRFVYLGGGKEVRIYREANTLNLATLTQGDLVIHEAAGNVRLEAPVGGWVSIAAGTGLRIEDSTGSDFLELSHDGTDFNQGFTNTVDWNVSGLTGNIDFEFDTDFYLREGTAIKLHVSHGANYVWVRDGYAFRVGDSGDTDYAAFSHNGTSFATDFTNTLYWNLAGFSTGGALRINQAGVPLIIGTGDSADQDIFLQFRGDRAWRFKAEGVDAGQALALQAEAGNKQFQIQNVAGTVQFAFNASTASTTDPWFRIYDDGGTDYAEFLHDGTNFTQVFTNTSAWIVSGAAEIDLTTTTFDVNATATDLSGTLDVAGFATFTGDSGGSGTEGALNLVNDHPDLYFTETNGPTDEKIWRTIASGGGLFYGVLDDAGGSAASYMTIHRTGATIDEVQLDATLIDLNGTVDFSTGVALGGGATPTLGTIGGSGPTTAAQAQWLQIDIGGTTHWIPVWT